MDPTAAGVSDTRPTLLERKAVWYSLEISGMMFLAIPTAHSSARKLFPRMESHSRRKRRLWMKASPWEEGDDHVLCDTCSGL